MGPTVDFHNVRRVELFPVKQYQSSDKEGTPFKAFEIRLYFEDGSSYGVRVYSGSGNQIEIKAVK